MVNTFVVHGLSDPVGAAVMGGATAYIVGSCCGQPKWAAHAGLLSTGFYLAV